MRKVNVVPLDGFILVKPIKETDKSGFEIPESLQKNKNLAEVLEVCANVFVKGQSVKPQIKRGDQVYVDDYINRPLEVEEEKYFFVRYEDVLGIQK